MPARYLNVLVRRVKSKVKSSRSFVMLTCLFLLVFAVLCFATQCSTSIPPRQTPNDFGDPPKQFRPKFRYWLPDASVDPKIVARDAQSIVANGGGGFEFLPFYFYGLPTQANSVGLSTLPTDWSTYGFGTPAFVDILAAALQAIEDAGGVMDFALGPNQGAGVPAETLTEGLAVQLLMGNVTVEAGETFSGEVPPPLPLPDTIMGGLGFQHPLLNYGRPNLTAVIAAEVLQTGVENVTIGGSPVQFPFVYLNESSISDLTSTVESGNLTWKAPPAKSSYRIISFWQAYTNQKECAGGLDPQDFVQNGSWIVDHFSAQGAQVTTNFWDNYILNDTEVAELISKVGKYSWEDSIEMLASLYWTPDLIDRFRKLLGYDPIPYLPLFYNPSNSWNGVIPTYSELYSYGTFTPAGESIHVVNYRTALNSGYQDYINHFVNWAHRRGVKYSDQPAYNLPLDMSADIPALDAPEGESLGFGDLLDAYRQFSGPAHLAGRNVISTEVGAVNVPPYSLTIPALLSHIKRSLAGGFTMSVIHGSPYSANYPNTTWPGYVTFFWQFTDMWNSIQPVWAHMKDVLDYVGRNQFVLQQGVPKVDLAFYLYAAPWKPVQRYESSNLEDLGYTYDYLGPSNLLSKQAVVEKGVLAPFGPEYKALIFSNQTTISADAVQKLSQFAADGLPIIFVGTPPNQSLSGLSTEQSQVQTGIQTLLNSSNVHAVRSASQLPTSLQQLGILPRAALNCSSSPVYSQWRTDTNNSIEYALFFSDQQTASQCSINITTAYMKASPYIYDAWTGERTPLVAFTRDGNNILLDTNLQVNETLLLAFDNSDKLTTASRCGVRPSSPGTEILGMAFNNSASAVTALINGSATFTSQSGKTWSFNSANITNATSSLQRWDLQLDSWHAPDDPFNVTSDITTYHFYNISLMPWQQFDSRFQPVSGIGYYSTNVTVPAVTGSFGALLSLGPIQHTVRAKINGISLPPISPSKAVIDISSYVSCLKMGQNFTLDVEVTSLLFNTIKATANKTMVWGYTADHQQGYASMPYMDNGLLGPVTVQWGTIVALIEDAAQC